MAATPKEAGPAWTTTEKLTISKRPDDLQWQQLHSALAMGIFVLHLDLVALVACPFCKKEVEETFPQLLGLRPVAAAFGCTQHPLWHTGLILLPDCVHLLYPILSCQGEHDLPDQVTAGSGQDGD